MFLKSYIQKKKGKKERKPAVDSPVSTCLCSLVLHNLSQHFWLEEAAIITSNQWVEQWSCINSRQAVCHLLFSKCPTAVSLGIVVDIWRGPMTLQQMSSEWATEGTRQGGAVSKESNCVFVDADSWGFGAQLKEMPVKYIIIVCYTKTGRTTYFKEFRVHSQAAKIQRCKHYEISTQDSIIPRLKNKQWRHGLHDWTHSSAAAALLFSSPYHTLSKGRFKKKTR